MEKKLILSRHSVRRYRSVSIPDNIRELIDKEVAICNSLGNIKIVPVYDEPHAFGKSIMAHYGKFSGVTDYFCLIAEKADDAQYRLGYYGERIVLFCQSLGLNTCWVGLSYKKSEIIVPLTDSEKLYAVIAFGFGENQGVPHKIKRPVDVAPDISSAPDWFIRGVEYALLAPTALNQQKFTFHYCGGHDVKARSGRGFFTKMDLGIVSYHFCVGAAPVEINWV